METHGVWGCWPVAGPRTYAGLPSNYLTLVASTSMERDGLLTMLVESLRANLFGFLGRLPNVGVTTLSEFGVNLMAVAFMTRNPLTLAAAASVPTIQTQKALRPAVNLIVLAMCESVVWHLFFFSKVVSQIQCHAFWWSVVMWRWRKSWEWRLGQVQINNARVRLLTEVHLDVLCLRCLFLCVLCCWVWRWFPCRFLCGALRIAPCWFDCWFCWTPFPVLD